MVDSGENFEFKMSKDDRARLDEMPVNELKALSERATNSGEFGGIQKKINKKNTRFISLVKRVSLILAIGDRERVLGNLNEGISDLLVSDASLISVYRKAKAIIESREVELWILDTSLGDAYLVKNYELMRLRVIFVCGVINKINKELAYYADEKLASI